jgi:hypothetical protein
LKEREILIVSRYRKAHWALVVREKVTGARNSNSGIENSLIDESILILSEEGTPEAKVVMLRCSSRA